MKTNTLSPELLHKMDAYWRAANYLSVGQIYLDDNPLLKQPLKPTAGPTANRLWRFGEARRPRCWRHNELCLVEPRCNRADEHEGERAAYCAATQCPEIGRENRERRSAS